MEKPLVNKKYRMEKYPGKGGWTYVIIREIPKAKRAKGGTVKVKGTIDEYEINNFCLMPMADGGLFLSVKAAIRKKIRKKEGDTVHITLYHDRELTAIPEEFLLCLQDDPETHRIFLSFSDGQQKEYIQWIYSAKKEETKINRMAKTLNKVSKGLKMYDKE